MFPNFTSALPPRRGRHGRRLCGLAAAPRKAPTPVPTPIPTPVPPERVPSRRTRAPLAERRHAAVREQVRELLEDLARRGGGSRQRRGRRGPRRGDRDRARPAARHPGRRASSPACACPSRTRSSRSSRRARAADWNLLLVGHLPLRCSQSDDPARCDELYAFRTVLFRFDDRPQVALEIVHAGEPHLLEAHVYRLDRGRLETTFTATGPRIGVDVEIAPDGITRRIAVDTFINKELPPRYRSFTLVTNYVFGERKFRVLSESLEPEFSERADLELSYWGLVRQSTFASDVARLQERQKKAEAWALDPVEVVKKRFADAKDVRMGVKQAGVAVVYFERMGCPAHVVVYQPLRFVEGERASGTSPSSARPRSRPTSASARRPMKGSSTALYSASPGSGLTNLTTTSVSVITTAPASSDARRPEALRDRARLQRPDRDEPEPRHRVEREDAAAHPVGRVLLDQRVDERGHRGHGGAEQREKGERQRVAAREREAGQGHDESRRREQDAEALLPEVAARGHHRAPSRRRRGRRPSAFRRAPRARRRAAAARRAGPS